MKELIKFICFLLLSISFYDAYAELSKEIPEAKKFISMFQMVFVMVQYFMIVSLAKSSKKQEEKREERVAIFYNKEDETEVGAFCIKTNPFEIENYLPKKFQVSLFDKENYMKAYNKTLKKKATE